MSASTFTTQRQLMMKNMPASALDNPFAKQQKMLLYLMPIFFAISGVNFPIGVLLYWLTTNVWSMCQQFYVIRKMPAPGSLAEKAMQDRRRKKGKPVEEFTVKGLDKAEDGRGSQAERPARAALAEQEEEGRRRPSQEAGARAPPQTPSPRPTTESDHHDRAEQHRRGRHPPRPLTQSTEAAAERPTTRPPTLTTPTTTADARPTPTPARTTPTTRATRTTRTTSGDRRGRRDATGAPRRRPAAKVADLEREGEVAADFLETLLDIADLDGDIDVDVDGDRAAVSIVDSDEGRVPRRLVGQDGKVLDALQELTRLAVQSATGERSRLMLDVAGHRAERRADAGRGRPHGDRAGQGHRREGRPRADDGVRAQGRARRGAGRRPRRPSPTASSRKRFVVVLPA